jgi:hypothetical protein
MNWPARSRTGRPNHEFCDSRLGRPVHELASPTRSRSNQSIDLYSYVSSCVCPCSLLTRPLQPSKSPPRNADSTRNVQDNDSLDDSLPSLDELFQASQNGDIPQVPHQNHKPVHISKRQLIDESRLVTDSTTTNLVYVLGNSLSWAVDISGMGGFN